ncbi:MAG: MSEP-CTERM sorting domain-containing protein, partial [Bacteroidetes bacterium]
MQKYLDPRWLFLLHTLPVLVFFFLMWGEFGIIKHVLTTENQSYWAWFGGALILITTLNFLYAYYRYMQKEPVSLWYGLISLLLHIGFLYAYFLNAAQIVPFTIPRWMVPENLILYAGTFLMPSMAYSLGVLVMYSRPSEKSRAWVNFLATLAIPLLGYFFVQVVLPLWRIPETDYAEHFIVVSIISGTLGFLFLLLRGIYILVIKKGIGPGKGIRQLWWKVPVSILLPQLGLAVNQGFLLGSFYFNNEGIFGNFNNPWFYILASVNGILLCLPELEHKVYRLILFAGRWLLMAYTFYFFIVFLPFLPFSVLAIVAFGLGFLMLVPLLLFVLHVSTLAADIAWLKAYFPTRNLRLLALACALCIPGIIVGKYLNDRRVLHEALDYVYTPDYAKSYDINRASLSATLGEVMQHKERGRTFVMGAQLPYLSPLFNWLVLDNMTLSDHKTATLFRIFYGENYFES